MLFIFEWQDNIKNVKDEFFYLKYWMEDCIFKNYTGIPALLSVNDVVWVTFLNSLKKKKKLLIWLLCVPKCRQVQHGNVVPFIGACTKYPHFWIVTGKIPSGCDLNPWTFKFWYHFIVLFVVGVYMCVNIMWLMHEVLGFSYLHVY